MVVSVVAVGGGSSPASFLLGWWGDAGMLVAFSQVWVRVIHPGIQEIFRSRAAGIGYARW